MRIGFREAQAEVQKLKQEFYYDFIETPNTVNEPLPWLEGLLYVARNEYKRQTGTELHCPGACNHESFTNPVW